jgi:hypothetical protein
MLVSVNHGGHWIPLVGYADLDSNGLPQTAIVADNTLLVYWDVDLLDWHAPERTSLNGITPWNHHLDRGCEDGGWARSLDATIRQQYGRSIADKFRLCRMPEGWQLRGTDRYYGIELTCERGRDSHKLFAYPEDPFISERRNISCDKLTLRWRDGTHRVVDAMVHRYKYDARLDRWTSLSHYAPNRIDHRDTPPTGRMGPTTKVVWDDIWRDGYWLVGQNLSGTSPKRRTTIQVWLEDGSLHTIEVTPPNTYGITIGCLEQETTGDGSGFASRLIYQLEADHDVFRVDQPDHDFMMVIGEPRNMSCDAVSLNINLGADQDVPRAEIQRYYYGASGEWRPAKAVWNPDRVEYQWTGLSGRSRYFLWDRRWEENNWLSAHEVGAGATRGDRKTVIRLRDAAGNIIRVIQIVPQIGRGS